VAAQAAVRNELASGDGVPSEAQRARLERADRLMKMATRFDLPLIILAALMMAVARYL
jgi:acetyl-CoA carboxylase alpha subunit